MTRLKLQFKSFVLVEPAI